MKQTPSLDRVLGSMLGLAIGDAVGTTVEFSPRGTFAPVTDMIGGGRFMLAAGQWTDDTAMALCLAESLLHDPALDQADLLQRFRNWVEHGSNSSTGRCFGIGRTTLRAISHFHHTGQILSGSTGPLQAGNGSIMRLAPVAARWWRDPAQAEAVALRQGGTTHEAPEAMDACALLTRVLCAGIAGQGRAALSVQQCAAWAAPIREIAQGSWRGKLETDIRSTGYVAHTLEAALWSVYRTNGFEAAILTAVNLGDDADTVGAVTGQIAGALYGYEAIPRHWRERLYYATRIEEFARQLDHAGA